MLIFGNVDANSKPNIKIEFWVPLNSKCKYPRNGKTNTENANNESVRTLRL